MTATTDHWLDRLHAEGYRLTGPRRLIADIIATSPCALSPLQIYERARREARGKAVGLVTVYRTLEKLAEVGAIQRVHQPSGCEAYLPAAQGHQHLLLCQKCGLAQYFEGDDLEALIHSLAARTGFRITEHWLQLFGVCAACQAQTGA